jgi:cytochrome c oxidase assembly protein subunit 15
VTFTRFRWLATASVVTLVLIVVSGATVRLTASGLGCEHWPGCQAGQPLPETGYHSYIEFGNRAISGITVLLAVAVAVLAWRVADVTRRQRWLATAVAVGSVLQIPLGGVTVYFHLNPWLVMSHFLLSIASLAFGVALVLDLWPDGQDPEIAPSLSLKGLLVAVAAGLVIVSGTFATAAGPHPGDRREIERLGKLTTAVPIHALATALFLTLLVLCLGALLPIRAQARRAWHTLLRLLVVVALQAVLGLVQYHEHLPWGLVLIHVALATALWTGSVALAVTLWRPRVPAQPA